MERPASSRVVAVINSTPDTIEMIRIFLQYAGLVVVSAYTHDIREGRTDIRAFMAEHRPRVVVYDIAPPYDQAWQFFQHIRATPAMQGVRFVITSTNAAHVQRLAGKDDLVYEVIGKPYDLERIAQATKEALKARPVR